MAKELFSLRLPESVMAAITEKATHDGLSKTDAAIALLELGITHDKDGKDRDVPASRSEMRAMEKRLSAASREELHAMEERLSSLIRQHKTMRDSQTSKKHPDDELPTDDPFRLFRGHRKRQ